MTFCYSAQSLQKSAAVMSGVTPLLSPPIFMATFDPALLSGHALIFFKLHGLPEQPYWYGDNALTACSAEQLASADIGGALVFAANCYGGAKAPMVEALMEAGAISVITGTGLNWAGQNVASGADVLGRVWRFALSLGATAEQALAAAKVAAFTSAPGLWEDIHSFALVGNGKARLPNGTSKSKGR